MTALRQLSDNRGPGPPHRLLVEGDPDLGDLLRAVFMDAGYGASWEVAAWMRARPRPVPAVMFTADAVAVGRRWCPSRSTWTSCS